MILSPTALLGAESKPRSLHAGHFAFMRAVIQGLDSRQSWDRYLRLEGAHHDARQVKRTVGWIRDEFAAAATRHGRPGMARLVIMELSSLDQAVPALPALSDFIRVHNLENFSEAEQIEQYQQHHIVSHKSHLRRSRLLARQLDALNWLQQTIAQLPHPQDSIANWIHPALAAHLAAASLHRLIDLVTHMDCFGARWWRHIDAVGATKAARITQWVALHSSLSKLPQASGKHDLGKNASLPNTVEAVTNTGCRQVAPALPHFVPLAQLRLPLEITQSGPLRAAPATCRIAATDDSTAIRAWLDSKARSSRTSSVIVDQDGLGTLSHTQRAYWKEVERFMLWLISERQIGLSSVSAQDCALYQEFIAAPTVTWCAPRGYGKWHPRWRPFEGPLSLSARRFALTVMRNLYRYLVQQQYFISSPWETLAVPSVNQAACQRRRFNSQAWDAIDRALGELPVTSANQRLALAIGLISTTGLRVGALVQAQVNDLSLAEGLAQPHLRLITPGGKVRYLAVPLSLARGLCNHLRDRGLDTDPQAATNRGAYLLGRAADAEMRAPWAPCARQPFNSAAGIGAGTLRDQIKLFFQLCEAHAVAGEPQMAVQFAAASSEWLRAGRPKNTGFAGAGTIIGASENAVNS